MHFWSRRENRALARLQSRRVVLIADQLPALHRTPEGVSSEDTTFITEVADQLRLQPLIFANGQSFIKAVSGDLPRDRQRPGWENATKSLAEQEADLIANYDAHFLSSMRIKPPVQL